MCRLRTDLKESGLSAKSEMLLAGESCCFQVTKLK